jgi:hypothetical protein
MAKGKLTIIPPEGEITTKEYTANYDQPGGPTLETSSRRLAAGLK